jgi:hypothetical protein
LSKHVSEKSIKNVFLQVGKWIYVALGPVHLLMLVLTLVQSLVQKWLIWILLCKEKRWESYRHNICDIFMWKSSGNEKKRIFWQIKCHSTSTCVIFVARTGQDLSEMDFILQEKGINMLLANSYQCLKLNCSTFPCFFQSGKKLMPNNLQKV